jgi:hypothetical protein
MVARMPELREVFLHRRWFLSRRTAAFDLAAAGAVAAIASRRRSARTLAALAVAPYLRGLVRHARRAPGRTLVVAAADLAADAVGFGALAAGSVRFRRPVL